MPCVSYYNHVALQQTIRTESSFTVIVPIIRLSEWRGLKHLGKLRKVDSMTPEIRQALLLIPFKS